MPADVSAYTPLANITLASATSEVNFTSISSGYRDLVLVFNGSLSSGTAMLCLQMNDNGSNNTQSLAMVGNGSGFYFGQQDAWVAMFSSYVINNLSTTPCNLTANIVDYSANNKHKTVIFRSDNASLGVSTGLGRWGSNDIINKVRVFATASTFAAGSTFELYGVSA